MFFTDGKLRGLEKFMQLPKYPTKRGGGKYCSSYHYTKGDCNCVNCLHWKKKYGCSQKVCPYIQERIDFLDKKRSEGKPYYVYMTAGMTKFLRIYYGKVRDCLKEQGLWEQTPDAPGMAD